MVSTRKKRVRGPETPTENQALDALNSYVGGGEDGYQQLREQRIKENKERMQKLGILDLSLKLNSRSHSSKTPTSDKNNKPQKPPQSSAGSASPRRSSRLKTMVPVRYTESPRKKKGKTESSNEIHIKEGSQPEIYTEEHDKLLGDCKESWTLMVDGYDENGKRIYDQVDGESCHQCRQKTLGRHTHCSKCKIVQGQFCGDCLYMRYGENVIEVGENPDWICPVCRGICNCSNCRKAKGWMPTGAIYRKVKRLGYKSVAHYLIQTRCSQTCIDSCAKYPSLGGQPQSLHDESLDLNNDPEIPPPQEYVDDGIDEHDYNSKLLDIESSSPTKSDYDTADDFSNETDSCDEKALATLSTE